MPWDLHLVSDVCKKKTVIPSMVFSSLQSMVDGLPGVPGETAV